MIYKTILDKHGNSFPHRFLVKYAVACAKSCSHLTSKKCQAALAVAERYGNGEDVSEEERKKAWRDVYAAATTSAAAAAAAYASATSATYATYAARAAEEATSGFDATALLVSMMKEQFTEFDMIMMDVDNKLFNK